MSKQTSKTLLPCPFCGGKAGIHRSHDADGMLWVGVRCQGCEAASTQYWCSPGNDCPIFYECVRNSWNRRPAHELTSARASNEQLAQALRNLRDVAHREVSPRYSAALDEAFTLADIALGEFDSEGDVSREADVGPGEGVRATHATGSAPSKPGAAEPPTAPTSEEQLRATAQQMLNDGYSHMLVDPLDILRLTGQSGGKQS